MKKLLFIGVMFILVSCDYTEKLTTENEQKKVTNINIIEAAQKDSVLFKKVVIDEHIYFVNNKTNLVEIHIEKNADIELRIIVLFFLLSLIFLLGVKLGDS